MLEEFDFQKNIGENKDIFEWFQEVYSVKQGNQTMKKVYK